MVSAQSLNIQRLSVGEILKPAVVNAAVIYRNKTKLKIHFHFINYYLLGIDNNTQHDILLIWVKSLDVFS